jgi:4-oxalomesaconate tautomerase
MPMLRAIPCTLMRGGTSKGLYFNAKDLPADRETRDRVLLAAMGSPDVRQIDGVGGAHPLTSKVAVISRSQRDDADVDYLFLQVVVDKSEVSDSQNCGNILAGVGPWAIENGLVKAQDGVTPVRIHMVNTGSIAVAYVQTPQGLVEYEGEARIDGVPGTAAPIPTDFLDVAGSSCGALLPTGAAVDVVDGIEVTCIDNGMPVVILRAADFGKTGEEPPEALEADAELKARVEKIRLALGPRMNLGDVTKKTVPKMTLVSPAKHGGIISTRTFIPHRVHEAIGVLGAVSVATACVLPGSVAAKVAGVTDPNSVKQLDVEHPTGFFTVDMDVAIEGGELKVRRSALLRTARKLMSGQVFVPGRVWSGA